MIYVFFKLLMCSTNAGVGAKSQNIKTTKGKLTTVTITAWYSKENGSRITIFGKNSLSNSKTISDND